MKPTVGTKVRWDVIFHNPGTETATIADASLVLQPRQTGGGPAFGTTTITQADLDAGVATFEKEIVIGSPQGDYTLAIRGELPLPKDPSTSIAAEDRVTASVRGAADLEPGEQVKVGTVVHWIVTFHHHSSDSVTVNGTTLDLSPGRSGYVEDTTKPTTITQADLDAGTVTYSSAFGITTPAGGYTIPATGELTFPKPAPAVAEHPALSGTVHGEFAAPRGSRVATGTRITWTATLTNTGDVPLHDVHVADSEHLATLAAGATADLTFSSTVEPEDVRDGFVFGSFSASGTSPAGSRTAVSFHKTLTIPSDGQRIGVHTVGEYDLAPGEQVKVGTPVEWTITVAGIADGPLRDVRAEDESAGVRSETISELTRGEIRQLHLRTTVTDGDLRAGRSLLLANVLGASREGDFSTAAVGEVRITTEHPRLEASATGAFDLEPGQAVTVGTKIIWTVTAKNTGDVSFVGLDPEGPGSIAVGETKVYRVADAVTQEDLTAGVVRRVSTAKGRRTDRPTYVSAPYLGILPIPAATDGAVIGGGAGTGIIAIPTTAPTVGGDETTVDQRGTAGPVAAGRQADAPARAATGAQAGATAASASAPALSPSTSTGTSTTPRDAKHATAAHLAQTGADTAAALPAAGILGLLGALGMLLGARRRRRTAA